MGVFFNESVNEFGIIPHKISAHELAWKIDDAIAVLRCIAKNNMVVLGGDVLDANKKHTYDNWYYNYNFACSLLENVEKSVEKATEYISKYIAYNGSDYYIVLVWK